MVITTSAWYYHIVRTSVKPSCCDACCPHNHT